MNCCLNRYSIHIVKKILKCEIVNNLNFKVLLLEILWGLVTFLNQIHFNIYFGTWHNAYLCLILFLNDMKINILIYKLFSMLIK